MTAKIEFTATSPSGEAFTRTSPSMPYTHVLMTRGPGQLVGQKESGPWGPYSWHKSAAAAFKASQSTYMQQFETRIVEAVPTAVKGKAEVGDFAGWANEDAINALIEAKNEPKAKAERKPRRKSTGIVVDRRVPAPVEVEPVDPTPMTEEQETEAIEQNLAPAPGVKKATKKQLLGQIIHAAAHQALAERALPEGMDIAEAEEVVAKWLQYIPTPATPGGWQPKA